MKPTRMNNQLDFPTIRDWREPQILSANGLRDVLTEAARAGFNARVLEPWKKPFGYRVTFQQQSKTDANIQFV